MKIKIFKIFSLTILLSLNCKNYNQRKVYQKTFFQLDTVVTITITENFLKPLKFKKISLDIENLLEKYDKIFNIHNKKSDVYKISKFKKNKWYKINKELFNLIKICKKFYSLTEGYFDPTIGSITLLYKFHNNAIPPSLKEISKFLLYVGMNNVTLKLPNFISLNKVPIFLDFGGVAKGYIIDKISDFLKLKGIKNFMVNIGGDIYVSGKNPKNSKWVIGIQHPRIYNEIVTKFEITNKSIVTSGDYERFFFYNGKRYHHIINPKTGLPVWNGIVSVTIIADSALIADILSTSVFLMGKEKGINLLKSFNEIKYLIIEETNYKELKFYSNYL